MEKSNKLGNESLDSIKDTSESKVNAPREKVPGIPISSSTITKGTSKVAETKAAKDKEKEMATTNDSVRGPGGRFVKKQEEPLLESEAKPVPKTEVVEEPEIKKDTPDVQKPPEVVDKDVEESMPREEVHGIPISSTTITKGTSKVAETKTAKDKEEEMAPPIEKEQKEEPTPELKAEPVPETEDVKESEVKKDIPGIPEPSSPDIEKQAKEAEEETGKVVKIVKTETGKVFVLVKNASDKLIKAIGKPIISDVMKKTVITSMSAIKHPVDAVSNFDKKVTKVMKRLTYFSIRNNSPNSKNNRPNSKNNNNKTVVIVLNADRRITKSVKDFFNSII